MNKSSGTIRKLIDNHFSLQWCRENIVVPIGIERNEATGSQRLTIAIGNFSYLATIGDFIIRQFHSAPRLLEERSSRAFLSFFFSLSRVNR